VGKNLKRGKENGAEREQEKEDWETSGGLTGKLLGGKGRLLEGIKREKSYRGEGSQNNEKHKKKKKKKRC